MYATLMIACFVLSSCAENLSIITSWKNRKFNVLNHFWRNTGFSPPGDPESRRDHLLSYDEKMNLAIVGSVPNNGIEHIRIHWILDLVTVKGNHPKVPVFDFERLDELMDWLHTHELTPTFELMGNPSNYFSDFRFQSEAWNSLLRQIVSRYLDRYGAVYVYNWRFELTNEPDLKMYNTLNFTLPQYIDYFTATEKTLGKLMGPAGLFKGDRHSHPLCWGLLDYCNVNPCKLKVITYHRKGEGVGSKIVHHGLNLIRTIKSSFANLSGIAFGNDEADIMTGWHKPFQWRTDVRYAALVLQVVVGHLSEMIVKRNIPFHILSNDNAFLNYNPHYFTQRTLLARFQMNNTNPPHVQYFRKPVYTVMGLLSLLGKYLLDVRYSPGENGFSFLTTAEKYRTYFLGAFTSDKASDEEHVANGTTFDLKIGLTLEGERGAGVFVVFVMDNRNCNPHQAWRDGGSPDFPDKSTRRKMRASESLKRLYYKTLEPFQRKISVALPKTLNPAVVAINVCNEKYKRPGRPENLHFMKVNDNEVLLLWSDKSVGSRCLLTYVVEFRSSNHSSYRRINDEDSIFLSYHFDGVTRDMEESVLGEYRVAALDYFGRHGPYSNVVSISSL